MRLGMVVHTFNLSNETEAEAGVGADTGAEEGADAGAGRSL